MSVTFSIIIPSYNYAKVLPRALESVLPQLSQQDEVIVIDDGSQDNTSEVIKPYIQQKTQLRYHYQQNQGASTARNNGVTLSQNPYLIFLDPDDGLTPNILEKLRAHLASRPNIEALIGDYTSIEPDGTKKKRHNKKLGQTPRDRLEGYINKTVTLASGAIVLKRKVFDLVSYDPHLQQGEDIPLFTHILVLFECALFPEPIAEIYKHNDSMRHQVNYPQNFAETLTSAIFDKSFFPAKLKAYRTIFLARRHLSMFRNYYRAKQFKAARLSYVKALKTSTKEALKAKLLFKWLHCFF